MRCAAIVVDLGFGDAGKGLITDFLTRSLGARLVVRFHGGAQAGHNVVTPDGRHHTFSQFGAGSFVPGVQTYLSRDVIVHPTALLAEAAHLQSVGVHDPLARLVVDARALLITPFHQAACRLRELARGEARHGSCGVGVGETVGDALQYPGEALRTGDFRDPHKLRRSLLQIQERKRAELLALIASTRALPDAAAERTILEESWVVERWIEAARPWFSHIRMEDEEWLSATLSAEGAFVFEGAQGVLLDEWAGFHPHTTWSTCTFEKAIALLDELHFAGEVLKMGVLRTYLVRHGAGPFPTEDGALDAVLPEPHNALGPWQGRVRRGFADMVLGRYAIDVCGGIDALALTHGDTLSADWEWKTAESYRVPGGDEDLFDEALRDGARKRILPPFARDLDRQARLGRALARVLPRYAPLKCERGESKQEAVIRAYQEALGVKVKLLSTGPSAKDVKVL